MLKNQDAIRRLFRVDPQRDRLGNQPPLTANFPGYDAPVVRKGDDGERELVRLNWGFVLLQPGGKVPKRVTNARRDKVRTSGFWKSSLEQRRCLVPVTSFAEPTATKPAEWYWFGRPAEGDDVRPLFAFAGIWRIWKGTLKVRGEEVTNPAVYSFLTVPPNDVVKPIHKKAMPAVLTTSEQHGQWLDGTTDGAMKLARPAPIDAVVVVHRGEKADAA